jgi:hypothetical protein
MDFLPSLDDASVGVDDPSDTARMLADAMDRGMATRRSSR